MPQDGDYLYNKTRIAMHYGKMRRRLDRIFDAAGYLAANKPLL
jgi:hypothetical protein